MSDEHLSNNTSGEKPDLGKKTESKNVPPNVASVNYNFTLPQIITVISFIGTAIAVIAYAFSSYRATVTSVDKLEESNKQIEINIDSLRIQSAITSERVRAIQTDVHDFITSKK